jgi:hypothetical protein
MVMLVDAFDFDSMMQTIAKLKEGYVDIHFAFASVDSCLKESELMCQYMTLLHTKGTIITYLKAFQSIV